MNGRVDPRSTLNGDDDGRDMRKSVRSAETDMKRVRIFLKTELFTLPNEGHVPGGTTILDAHVREHVGGGFTVEAHGFYDIRGRTLEGPPRVLWLPTSKIDHVLLVEEP